MSRVVTVAYLRRRFWVAKLILLVTLAAAAGVAFFALKAQENRSEYAIALQHLGNSVTGLEHELDHLVYFSRRGVASRDRAWTLFSRVEAQFRNIVMSSRGEAAPANRPLQVGLGEAPGDQEGFHLAAGPMPESLARIWVPGSGAADAGPSANLEYVLDRILLLTGQLVRAQGPLSPREADRVQTIKASIAALVTPRLEEITAVLDGDLHSSIDRALASLLALLAVAALVAMLNIFIIFRPLETAVMAAQAGLEVERDRALEAAAAKRNFLSIISHELRTPMNGVLGFAQLLLASELKPEQRRQVEIIRSSGKTLLALVNDILDLSRMEAGGLELADEPFSLEEVTGEVLDLARAGMTGKDIETAIYIDPHLPAKLRGDPERVRQILTNLVGNAVKFAERGTVAVEVRWLRSDAAEGPTVEIAVADNGPGIPPDQQARIFERFTQAKGPGREAPKGTGLGLAICRELSERMGGDIAVESLPGEGATFRVHLRLVAADHGSRGAGAAESTAPLAGLRVLVINENAIAVRLLRRQLEGWGLVVEVAACAKDAWRLLDAAGAEAPYRLVLIDGALTDTDPGALARRIRADSRMARAGLLLVAEPGSEAARTAPAAGFDAVEATPLLPRALRAALTRLAGNDAGNRDDSAGGTPETRGRPRILLAEDHDVSRQLVIRILEGGGYNVEGVGDGASAVEAAARGEHDLVLMDIRMPCLDGVEATRRIRALGGAAGRLPILALTANTSVEDLAEYRAVGMDDVIPKPIEADRLLAAVGGALHRAASSSPSDEPAAGARSPEGSAAQEMAAQEVPEGMAAIR